MSQSRTLSVVVPVYYNEGSLAQLHARLRAVGETLEGMGLALEMVFVDDGSGDGSRAELMKIKATDSRAVIVCHARNFGAFPAMKSGIAVAVGDCVATLSADLQDPPELLVDMAARWLAGEKFVIATRSSRDDPPATKAFAALYYHFLRALVMPEYPEGGFDFMLVDRIVVPHIVNGPKSVNLNLFTYWLGFKPSIIPYARARREHGKSRWTFHKKVRLFVDTITGFSARPIRLMSLFGLATALFGMGYGIWVVSYALILGSPQPGFPTLAALVSFFSGLIIFMLGVIGEYLWRILDAVNRKPEAVVERIW
ncbi:MAG: glycosyltransferase [Magnetospirillum sp.]|nr:MAG: glycosyltransferase [Magnetospirillum sp.]